MSRLRRLCGRASLGRLRRVARRGASNELVDGHELVALLVQLVEDGRRVGEPEGIEVAKARCREAFMHLDPATKRFLNMSRNTSKHS